MFIGTSEVIGNMPGSAYQDSRPSPWGFSASLGFHVVIGLALLLAVAPRRQVAPLEDSVTVDVLTPQQFDAANFRVGDAIPKIQWEDHNLAADDGPAD
jgi:hypothetical protein